MITIKANLPCTQPPAWALLERKLFEIMNEAVYPFLEKYTREDGTLIWRDEWPNTRDGLDDFFESFVNWPLLYLLGGGDHLLELSHKEWEALTHQFANLGPRSPIVNEYERGYDQFHQSEGYIFFYFLCLADPTNPHLIEQARRFAGLFLNEDPNALNYDPEHKIIRAPHNGSEGPRWGYLAGDPPRYGYSPGMKQYGLPYHDVPGIETYDDLKDPDKAAQMGAVMQERMGKGDVANNLLVTGLITNAYLLTGDEKLRDWLLEYVDAWVERARANDGLLPDNVGLSGIVGEYMDGRWYGSAYGWSWPHGFHNISYAATVAANNAYLLTHDPSYLDMPRRQMDKIIGEGKMAKLEELEMSLRELSLAITGYTDDLTFVVPYRYNDSGWFDYQPMSLTHPVALWNVSMADEDKQRLELLREKSGYDWRHVVSFRNKGNEGHEAPWLCYLDGENPDYPAQMLSADFEQIARRLGQIRLDEKDVSQVHIHHWQNLNPVVTEALVQLTLGAPQVIYYGGMLLSRVRYFDADRNRPGLPADVAALVEKLEADRTVLTLVNLNPLESRSVIVQAGGLGEHQFASASYEVRTNDYPGAVGTYTAPPLETESQEMQIDAKHICVELPPATQITLDIVTERFVNAPAYAQNLEE
ncbi:MAG: hypothetical protein K8L99_17290 [Anaerolineae bacterium]|nr:hypothetical protein [Anaerolineae bacterium]